MVRLYDIQNVLVTKGLPVFDCLGVESFTMEAFLLQ